MKPVIFFLTCADQNEADLITNSLLEKQLAVCIKTLPTSSTYRWKGEIEKSNEILLIIDSVEENFDHVSLAVKALHSYETYNLSMVTMSKTTDDILSWIAAETSTDID